MRILLTNPSYQSRVEHVSLLSVVPPLDLAYAAALIRQDRPQDELRLIDANALGIDDARLAAAIRRFRPDVVVFTAATYAIRRVATVAGAVAAPGRSLVLIGSHGSALPEESLAEIPALDVVVRGEPEWTVAALVSALGTGAPLAEVPGLVFRGPEGPVSTKRRPLCAQPDALPFPARDLLPNRRYSSPYSGHVTALRTSRGCPGRCRFCDSHLLFGSRTRGRDPRLVGDEIEECVRRWGVRYFAIIDHTFTANPDFVAKLCDEIEGRGLARRVRWVCNSRVDTLEDTLLRRMSRAGCVQVGVGMEGVHDERLAAVHKGVTVAQIERAIAGIRSNGMLAMGYAIIGLPDDTRESIAETRRQILHLDPHILQLSYATPLPGTALWRQARKENRLLSRNWDDYVFLRRPILRNDTLSTTELAELHGGILRDFYLRPGKIATLGRFVLFGGKVEFSHALRTGLMVLGRVARS